MNEVFQPNLVATTSVSLSTSSASGALNLPTAPAGNVTCRIYNAGTATAFIKFGGSSVTAATTDMPVPSGTIEVFQISDATTHVAGITASGTATLYATPGRGGLH